MVSFNWWPFSPVFDDFPPYFSTFSPTWLELLLIITISLHAWYRVDIFNDLWLFSVITVIATLSAHFWEREKSAIFCTYLHWKKNTKTSFLWLFCSTTEFQLQIPRVFWRQKTVFCNIYRRTNEFFVRI